MNPPTPEPVEHNRENLPPDHSQARMEALLEGQIARCSEIIDRIVDRVAQDGLSPNACVNFVSRLPSLMTSSAALGKVAWQFRELNRRRAGTTT
jgi:hypothetical protein